jgi:hypothetical protein
MEGSNQLDFCSGFVTQDITLQGTAEDVRTVATGVIP